MFLLQKVRHFEQSIWRNIFKEAKGSQKLYSLINTCLIDWFHRRVALCIKHSEDTAASAFDSSGSELFVQNGLFAKPVSLPHGPHFSHVDAVSRVHFVLNDVLKLGLVNEVLVNVKACKFTDQLVELFVMQNPIVHIFTPLLVNCLFLYPIAITFINSIVKLLSLLVFSSRHLLILLLFLPCHLLFKALFAYKLFNCISQLGVVLQHLLLLLHLLRDLGNGFALEYYVKRITYISISEQDFFVLCLKYFKISHHYT